MPENRMLSRSPVIAWHFFVLANMSLVACSKRDRSAMTPSLRSGPPLQAKRAASHLPCSTLSAHRQARNTLQDRVQVGQQKNHIPLEWLREFGHMQDRACKLAV